MILRALQVGDLQTNCYIVACEETMEGVVLDPGGDADRILLEVERSKLTILYVLLTHAHFDHTLANAEVVAATGARLALHPGEEPLLKNGGGAHLFGFSVQASPPLDLGLAAGQVIGVGRLRFEVLDVPGHSPGGIAFYEAAEGVVFVGDVLFASGIGRTDLPGGDTDTLIRSIQHVLFALPDGTRVYPGHGPATTIAREKADNPWVSLR